MKNKTFVLIVDDSAETREILGRHLAGWGFNTRAAANVSQAVQLIQNHRFDMVITDVVMPEQDGFQLLRHVHENHKDLEVLVITGFPHIEDAVRAIKQGAEEYLIKPFTEDELSAAVNRTVQKIHSRRHLEPTPALETAKGLTGESPAMREVIRAVQKAAKSNATVLLQGESGTGKEVVARAIHYSSKNASAPFIPVNCGAIPEQLVESELFGHVRGAFTGAIGARAGLFQAADRGTILMDEISEAGPAMQIKLLRVIQEKEIVMLGSNRPQKINVRLIAATNKDLHELVGKGLFREDLYYRLNVISINIPPLRERGDDLLLLIKHFLAKASRELGRPIPEFSGDALAALRNYNWPGNVRELENVILRLAAMTEGDRLDVPDLPKLMRFSALNRQGPFQTLAAVESEYIRTVLEHVGGNKTTAAGILGIDRKTLREKLKRTVEPAE
ncbi:MAG: sigma-54 dependent transcriptional regulator [Pseudomonadota bacterium]